ncbi:Serine/threonine-protein kinase PknB [Streptomyces sp. YIM 130001]|uniref:serine/threonine-protein kinase n=1 Tax=Streptomyces sp. YIM 130001 TaxID=2259644 RepID=UPI000EF0FB69|nr:serine/threonine-protein kinase [Streptomyces sp. YIM 130001]RII11804.1 Serine/threonine-protein kinase PknB [Streptomyces sp. YIM 130001]
MRGTLLDGRYRLGEPIGAGGMGEVWRARDEELGREVAVKIFAPAGDVVGPERDELLARFRREARAAAALSSPHIVTVFDHGTGRTQDAAGADIPYLVMELLPGRSFQEALREEGRIPLVTALEWTEQVCTALQVAHTAGVIHRDIKPGNLMVGPEGRVQVLDFGIATFLDGLEAASRLTRTGQSPLGSVLYMAPEQFRMERGDGRIDLYALGCVLYELLVGRPPFVGPSAGVMYNHLNDKPLLPSRARPELPHSVDQLVLALMTKVPQDRPADAAEARARVRAALELVRAAEEAETAAEPPTVRKPPTPSPAPDPAPGPAPDPAPPPAPPAVQPPPEAARRRPARSGLSAVERKRRHNEALRAAPRLREERGVDARRIRRVRRHDATAQDPEPYVQQREGRKDSPVMSTLFVAAMAALLFAPQVFDHMNRDDRDGSARSGSSQEDAASDSEAGSGPGSGKGASGPYTVAVVTSAHGAPRQSLVAERLTKDVPRHLRPEIVVKQVDSAEERAEVTQELAEYPNLLAVVGETTPNMLEQLRTPVVSTCHVAAQPVPRDDESVVSLGPDAVEQGEELATYLEETVKSRRLLVVSDRDEPADQDDAEHTTGVGGYLLRAYDNAAGLSALWASDREARGPAPGVGQLLDEVRPDAVVVDAPQERAEEAAEALDEAGFQGTMLLVDRHDAAGHCSDAAEPVATAVPAGTLRVRAVSRAVDGTVCGTAAEAFCHWARELPERRGAVEEYQAATLLAAALNSSEAVTDEQSVTKARESLKWSLDHGSVVSPEGTYKEKHTYAPGLRPLWLDRLGTGDKWQQVGLLTKGDS